MEEKIIKQKERIKKIEKKFMKYFDGFLWTFSYSYIPEEKEYLFCAILEGVDLNNWEDLYNRSEKFFSFVEKYGYSLYNILIREENEELVEITWEFSSKRRKMGKVLRNFWRNLGELLKLLNGRNLSYLRVSHTGHYLFTFHSYVEGYWAFECSSLIRLKDLITAFILGIIIMEKRKRDTYLDEEEIKKLSEILKEREIKKRYIHLKLLKGLE